MYEYKALVCDTNSLIKCSLSRENYIKTKALDSIIENTVDINDGHVTICENYDNTLYYRTIKLEEYEAYKYFKKVYEEEWLTKTFEGFEYLLNELGQQGFKMINNINDTFIFIREVN